MNLKVISVREQPEYKDKAIKYFQSKWKGVSPKIYDDCITHSINARDSLPQWYLLLKDMDIIGCAGLITNDFISRGDLYPWINAIFIDEVHRGKRYSEVLINKAKADAKQAGYKYVFLCTEHIGFYEKYGFQYIGQGYHPWGEESRIYELKL